MTFPFDPRHTLNVSEARRRAGVKGGEQPGLGNTMQPVIIMADFSSTYSGEPLEGRRVFAGRVESIPLPAGRRGYVEIRAQSAGGIVIEFFQCSVNGFTDGSAVTGTVFVDILPDTPGTFTPVGADPFPSLDCGAIPTTTFMRGGWTTASSSGAGPTDLAGLTVFTAVGGPASHLYVPPGSIFACFTSGVTLNASNFMFISAGVREIPVQIGQP